MVQSARNRRLRDPKSPIAIAFGVSVLIHLIVFLAIEYLPKNHWIRNLPVLNTVLKPKPSIAELLKAQAAKDDPKKDKEQEFPLVLVQVAPEQSTPEPPKEAKYYSELNSIASNPTPAPKESNVPKIEGSQDKVMRLTQNNRPTPAPKPPETTPTPPPQPEPQPKPPEPTPPKKQEPPKPTPEPPAPQQTPPPAPPGDLALARPVPTPPKPKPQPPAPTPTPTKPNTSPAPPVQRPPLDRPRTLAQVYQQNPQLRGERIKQDGGVKRRGAVALDVKASTFGAYDARVVSAIEERWYQLLEENSYSGERVGKVVLEFKFKYDGTVSEMKVAETTVGEVLALLCIRAVREPAPYEKWPSDMRLLWSSGFREVRFTFYYN